MTERTRGLPKKPCSPCPVFKLILVQLSALFSSTRTATPLTDEQKTQHGKSHSKLFVITSALPSRHFLCRPVRHSLYFYSCSDTCICDFTSFSSFLFLFVPPSEAHLSFSPHLYKEGFSVSPQNLPRIKTQVSISTILKKAEPL